MPNKSTTNPTSPAPKTGKARLYSVDDLTESIVQFAGIVGQSDQAGQEADARKEHANGVKGAAQNGAAVIVSRAVLMGKKKSDLRGMITIHLGKNQTARTRVSEAWKIFDPAAKDASPHPKAATLALQWAALDFSKNTVQSILDDLKPDVSETERLYKALERFRKEEGADATRAAVAAYLSDLPSRVKADAEAEAKDAEAA